MFPFPFSFRNIPWEGEAPTLLCAYTTFAYYSINLDAVITYRRVPFRRYDTLQTHFQPKSLT